MTIADANECGLANSDSRQGAIAHLNQQHTLQSTQSMGWLRRQSALATVLINEHYKPMRCARENEYRSGEGACPPRCSARPRRTPRAGSAPSWPPTSTQQRRTPTRQRQMRRAASRAPSTGTASRRQRWRRPAARRIGSGNPSTGRVRFEDGSRGRRRVRYRRRVIRERGGDEKGLDAMRHARGFSRGNLALLLE